MIMMIYRAASVRRLLCLVFIGLQCQTGDNLYLPDGQIATPVRAGEFRIFLYAILDGCKGRWVALPLFLRSILENMSIISVRVEKN